MRDILLNFMPTWCVFEWSDLTQKYFDKYPCGFLICISFQTSRQMVKCISLNWSFSSVSMMNRFEILWWQSVFLRFELKKLFAIKWNKKLKCLTKDIRFDKWLSVEKLDYKSSCSSIFYVTHPVRIISECKNVFNPPISIYMLKIFIFN